MVTTDHAGFLLAIAAGDRWVRESYLDWLTERDDPRAEFIRVQEELARLEDTENEFHHKGCVCIACRPVRSRSAELLTTYERDWRGAMVCGTCGDGSELHCDEYVCKSCWAVAIPKVHPNCEKKCPYCGCAGMSKRRKGQCDDCRGTGYTCWPLVPDSLGRYIVTSTFRRGFVHTVRAPLDVLLAPGVAETIGRYHPVERVEVSDRVPELDASAFVQAGRCWQWTNDLSESGLPPDLFAEVCKLSLCKDSPHLYYAEFTTPDLARDALSAALLPRFRPSVTSPSSV